MAKIAVALGVLLILLGIAGFALGGFTWTRSEKVAELGPIELERKEQRGFEVPPWASGVMLGGGVLLVLGGVVAGRSGSR